LISFLRIVFAFGLGFGQAVHDHVFFDSAHKAERLDQVFSDVAQTAGMAPVQVGS
jgi:hypothetical protein